MAAVFIYWCVCCCEGNRGVKNACKLLFCMRLGSACLIVVSWTTEMLLSAKLCGELRLYISVRRWLHRAHKNVVKIRALVRYLKRAAFREKQEGVDVVAAGVGERWCEGDWVNRIKSFTHWQLSSRYNTAGRVLHAGSVLIIPFKMRLIHARFSLRWRPSEVSEGHASPLTKTQLNRHTCLYWHLCEEFFCYDSEHPDDSWSKYYTWRQVRGHVGRWEVWVSATFFGPQRLSGTPPGHLSRLSYVCLCVETCCIIGLRVFFLIWFETYREDMKRTWLFALSVHSLTCNTLSERALYC